MSEFSLEEHGITVMDVRRNLAPSKLYEEAIRHDHLTRIAESGALVAYSGLKTGRSPKDKRIVRREPSEQEVWWGPVNFPLEPHSFEINRDFIFNQQVEPVLAHFNVAIVNDGHFELLLDFKPPLSQLTNQRVFIK